MSEPAAPAPARPRRRARRGRRLLFALLPLLLVVGGTEAVFRVRAARKNRPEGPGLHEPDPFTGYRMRPGITFEQQNGVASTLVHTNDLGHRGPPLASPKPPGSYRVACLGGSTTFGFGASGDATAYPAVLERRLREERPGRGFEVLNAGVQGWTVRECLTNFERHLAPLGFDLVVLMEAHNDVFESGTARYVEDAAAPDHEALRREPGLVARLLGHSAAWRELSERVRRHRVKHDKLAAVPPAGRAAFEQNLRRAVRSLRAQGAAVLLCTYPHLFPPAEAAARDVFGPYLLELTLERCPLEYAGLVAGIDGHNEAIRRIAAEEGVYLADLARDMPRERALYVDFIHHSDAGHARKAELILRAVLAGPLAAGSPPGD